MDARKGPADNAGYIYREDLDVPRGTRLAELRDAEIAQNMKRAAAGGTVASIVGLDIETWRVTRFTVTATPLARIDGLTAYEVGYLARPGLTQLDLPIAA